MADKSCKKKDKAVISETKKRPSSSTAESAKKVEAKPKERCNSSPTKKHIDDMYAKEEQYKLLNAELEAKTSELVRQAEQLMREQSEVLSYPLSNELTVETEDGDGFRNSKSQPKAAQDPGMKVSKKRVTSTTQSKHAGKQEKKPQFQTVTLKDSRDDEATLNKADLFLAKTILGLQEIDSGQENIVDNAEDYGGLAVSDAQTRVLKAKLRIMQEEIDTLSCDYHKKEEENSKLAAKIKELEEDRVRLQRTINIHQTQTEKQKALAEELARKCDDLQLQVSALNKEVETLTRSQKQAAFIHSTMEVRLNRAVEEAERLKSQLAKTKQMNKDKVSEEQQNKESLLAENQILKKQKAELIAGFKKQLKLIDILKRQKMHFEAAKLLSFAEEEFMKALDWGKS
ncbi:testis-expressed sequence 9 protein-like [Poecilia reticulata]|uniref:testis-expressed sequence 9 protein-like n=1 Tax=Poecilia reticulata TaxID=8081 RepID=UPI0004A25799|nr:PREDICTED: testis-expressed sequence 9 protein-like [Poecilia reticulata]